MTDHLAVRLLAAASIDQSLSSTEADELAAHLASCAACRQSASGMRRDHQALASVSPVATAPWVRDSILEAARGRRGPARWAVLAAAALLLALGIGIGLAGGAWLRDYRSLLAVEPVNLSATWTPVALAVPEDGSRLRAIVTSADGFLAGGASAEGATIWTSPDGLDWGEQASLPLGLGAEVATLVATEDLTLVAGQGPDGAVIWTTATDGRFDRWLLPGSDSGGGVSSMLSTGDGFIALGWRAEGGARSAAAWSSPDGRAWTAASVSAGSQLRAVAALPAGGYVAISGSPVAVLLFSSDGRDWEVDAESIDVVASIPGNAVTVVGFGGAVYGVGAGTSGSFAMWRSTDGRTWSDVVVPTLTTVDIHGARVVDGRLLIFGSTAAGPLCLGMTEEGTFGLHGVDAVTGSDGPSSFYDVAGQAGMTMVAVGVRGADAAVWAAE